MKHGKAPTVAQKIYIKSWRLRPENWLVQRDNQEEMVIEHRLSGKTRRLPPRKR